jgi:hypothetical protein
MNTTNPNFITTLSVQRTPGDVFNVVLNVRAWWSGLYGESFEGKWEKQGDEFGFLAGLGAHHTKQKLVELVPGKKVVWLVTAADVSFEIKGMNGMELRFASRSSGEEDKTKIVFTHTGLILEFECYASCAPAWTRYIHESLTNALSTTRQ